MGHVFAVAVAQSTLVLVKCISIQLRVSVLQHLRRHADCSRCAAAASNDRCGAAHACKIQVSSHLSRITYKMRNAINMLRLLRNPRVLVLLCSAIVLVGCQHPLAPSVAGHQPAGVSYALADTGTPALVRASLRFPATTNKAEVCMAKTGSPESPKPKGESLVGNSQQNPECLTVQLGDALLEVFKTLTDRH
jgi:hypothetical protein